MIGKRILLVIEDEPLVALAMQDSLEDAGYEVLVAEDGHAGTAVISARIHEVSGLITDIRLGSGPDGWRLAREARAIRPELPVLYVTGDSVHEWPNQGVTRSAVLQKPFVHSKLSAELQAVLA